MFFEYLNTIKGIIGLFIYKLLYFKRIEFKGIPKICNTNRIAIKRGSKVILNKGFRARYNLSIRAYDKGKIEIGENCFFNDGCSINCLESIKLGDNVICGQNVMFFDHDHDYKNDMNKFVTKPITVGNNVWIGANSIILKGVTIGDNVVIAAGSIVRENIENKTILYQKRDTVMKKRA